MRDCSVNEDITFLFLTHVVFFVKKMKKVNFITNFIWYNFRD
jgi:hypothetical protein